MFFNYPAVNNDNKSADTYGDATRHCPNWKYFAGRSDKVTAVHECTHGINAQVRNGVAYVVGLADDKTLIYAPAHFYTTKMNGFYLLEDRAIRVPEPNCRKQDAAKYIAPKFHGSRYDLYVRGQKEWDDSPLYLFDEWIAYINGAECAVSMGLGKSSDFLYAPIEFIPYCLAVTIAAPEISPELKFLVPWLLDKCMDLVRRGRAALPWAQMDTTLDDLITGTAGKPYRDVLATRFAYTLRLDVPPPLPAEIDPYV